MQNAQNSKSWSWLVWLLVAALVAVGAWMWWARQAAAPEVSETADPVLSQEDTTDAIEAELAATDFGDLEAELQATDADLNSL